MNKKFERMHTVSSQEPGKPRQHVTVSSPHSSSLAITPETPWDHSLKSNSNIWYHTKIIIIITQTVHLQKSKFHKEIEEALGFIEEIPFWTAEEAHSTPHPGEFVFPFPSYLNVVTASSTLGVCCRWRRPSGNPCQPHNYKQSCQDSLHVCWRQTVVFAVHLRVPSGENPSLEVLKHVQMSVSATYTFWDFPGKIFYNFCIHITKKK